LHSHCTEKQYDGGNAEDDAGQSHAKKDKSIRIDNGEELLDLLEKHINPILVCEILVDSIMKVVILITRSNRLEIATKG